MGTLKSLPKDATPQQVDISQRQLLQGIAAARAASTASFVSFLERVQSAYYVLRDRFAWSDGRDLRSVKRGHRSVHGSRSLAKWRA